MGINKKNIGFTGMAKRLPLLVAFVAVMFTTNSAQGQDPALRPDVVTKLLVLLAAKGFDAEIPATFAYPLGLSDSGQAWPSRNITVRDSSNLLHGLACKDRDDQNLVFGLSSAVNVRFYRTRRSGEVIKALSWDIASKEITVRSGAEAQTELNSELVFWNDNVDGLIAGEK